MVRRRHPGAPARLLSRWRALWPLAVVAGSVPIGRVLVDEVGSPLTLLRALHGLGDPWADPVAPLFALLALLAEGLADYALVVLALRSLCLVPGWVGRVAGRVALLVTPVMVRRLLDLLVGGTLLAQATLAATPGVQHGYGTLRSELAPATSTVASGRTCPVARSVLGPGDSWPVRGRHVATVPFATRPAPRRSAVPLPPWLGGGSSNTGPQRTDMSAPGPNGPSAPDPTGPGPGPTGPPAPKPAEPGPGPTGPPAPEPTETAPGPTEPEAVRYTVAVGDTLWDIAAAHLAPSERTVPNIHRYWRQVYQANRWAIGADPDLIHPGTRLDVRPFRRERR
jgi:LysM domain